MSSPPLLPPGGGRPRQPQVSLRGASVREMSRNALLHKVSEERESRSYARRASAAALLIQQVWRRYRLISLISEQYQEEWENMVKCCNDAKDTGWVCNCLLRPFLFFTARGKRLRLTVRDIKCTRLCFESLLQSINSPDPNKNFCSMAIGNPADRSTWLYQSRRLASLCLFLLTESNSTCHIQKDFILVTALGMRLLISLTDIMSWKCMERANAEHCAEMIKKLLIDMAFGKMYSSVRKYILELGNIILTDDKFLIVASATKLMLRPFHANKLEIADFSDFELMHAAEEYCQSILTIPYLLQRLPPILLSALRHESLMIPCLRVLLVAREKVFARMLKIDSRDAAGTMDGIPCVGWALSNVINLSTGSTDSGKFIEGLDYPLYVQAIGCLSESFLDWIEGATKSETSDISFIERVSSHTVAQSVFFGREKVPFPDQLAPVNLQWHLRLLLDAVNHESLQGDMKIVGSTSSGIKLFDIVFAYSNLLRIHKLLEPSSGGLPLLNMLSFTPGFLPLLWKELEEFFFSNYLGGAKSSNSRKHSDQMPDKKMKSVLKDAGDKWVHVFQKIAGKHSDIESSVSSEHPLKYDLIADENFLPWEIRFLGSDLLSIPKQISSLLYLFCAIYSHLLLILDDIEFYEKQVPFTLVQQKKIAGLLNNLVYTSYSNSNHKNKPLTDVAIQCLHMLYERDCRRRFCPGSLWLQPAKSGRLPVAAAARAHEVAFADPNSWDIATPMKYIITTMPHVFPFEERVQIFREFIKLDKSSRRAAGEVDGRGLGSIEIVVRRNHIIEDAFRQLNSLGSRLKSSFNVSFVSECELPEAGLDYGGLSKEFLTVLAKSAFSPQFGLFVQTCTPERLLFPNITAKSMDNGLDMFEFLGRIVGKALYEGILLDYSFSFAFVQKLLGRYSYLDELSTLDPEMYKNLMYVKHYDGNVENLSLDFTIMEEISGKLVTTELKPGGKNTTVTNNNKLQYVYAMSDYKLNRQILPLANAFFRGLSDLITPSWLRLFNGNEFNQLLSGGKHDFDVDDLKKNTKYTGGYSEDSRTIKLFWEVVRTFTAEERCLLLKFVTSCSRGPLLGFKYLQPTFTIQKVVCDTHLWSLIGGQDVGRLPSASTCYNTLKLPRYKRASTLKSKLLYAISSNAGFELS